MNKLHRFFVALLLIGLVGCGQQYKLNEESGATFGRTATWAEINNITDQDNLDLTWTSSSSNYPQLILKNTNTDSNPPYLRLRKESTGSAADNDEIGAIQFEGFDSGDNLDEYFTMAGYSRIVTSGSEAGRLVCSILMNGASRSILDINGYNGANDTGYVIVNNDDQDVDFIIHDDIGSNAFVVQGSDGVVSTSGAFNAGGQITVTGELEATALDINGNSDISGTQTIGGTMTMNGSIVFNGSLSGTNFLDEDTMVSDSSTAVASQQSIKAYVDNFAVGENTITMENMQHGSVMLPFTMAVEETELTETNTSYQDIRTYKVYIPTDATTIYMTARTRTTGSGPPTPTTKLRFTVDGNASSEITDASGSYNWNNCFLDVSALSGSVTLVIQMYTVEGGDDTAYLQGYSFWWE